MFKSILFLAALFALSVALGAFVLSGRAAHGFEGRECERIWARLARQVAPAETPGKARTRAAG